MSEEDELMKHLSDVIEQGAENLQQQEMQHHILATRSMANHFWSEIQANEGQDAEGIWLCAVQLREITKEHTDNAHTVDGRKITVDQAKSEGFTGATVAHVGRFPSYKAWVSGKLDYDIGCAMYEALQHPIGYLLLGRDTKVAGKRLNWNLLALGAVIVTEFWDNGQEDEPSTKSWIMGRDDRDAFDIFYRNQFGKEVQWIVDTLTFLCHDIRRLHDERPKVYAVYVEEMIGQIENFMRDLKDDEDDN